MSHSGDDWSREQEGIQPARGRFDPPGPARAEADDAFADDESTADHPQGIQAEAPFGVRRARPVERLTTYFGHELPQVRPGPTWPIFWSGLALVFLVLGLIARNPTVCLAAVPFPAFLAALLWLTRPRAQRLRFTEEGIEIDQLANLVRYDEIVDIEAPKQRSGSELFPIHVRHARGSLIIPPLTGESSERIYEFLLSQPRGQREANASMPVLKNFLKQQLLIHGHEQVYVYHARGRTSAGQNLGLLAKVMGALFLTGLTWAIFSPSGHDNALPPLGVAFSVIGGFMLVICGFVYLRGPAGKLRNSEMIITPTGLALVQGDLQGELTWAEVLAAKKYGNGGLRLKVAGAEIIIQDVYQWPLDYALRQIDTFRDNYRL